MTGDEEAESRGIDGMCAGREELNEVLGVEAAEEEERPAAFRSGEEGALSVRVEMVL